MRRILVYGVTGTGKSRLAARISDRTGLPLVQVDELTWQPGWVLLPEEEQRRRFTGICATDAWVLDSAYGTWVDVPLARADVVVGLDYPRWLSLAWLLRRSVARAADQRPICNGNTESWRGLFSSDSIIAWHFRSFASKRRRIRAWEADPAAPRVVRLTSPREAERWLASLSTTTPSRTTGGPSRTTGGTASADG